MEHPCQSLECQCVAAIVSRDVQRCGRCGEQLVQHLGWVEGHDDVAAASDTSSEDRLDAVSHTFVAAGIDVDAVEALEVRVDVVQHTASAWEEAASTGLGDSCTEAGAEASARSPRLVRPTWHATAAARSSEQSPQGSLGRNRCGTSAWEVEAYSQNDGVAGDDAYAAEALVATVPAHSHRSKQAKATDIPDA